MKLTCLSDLATAEEEFRRLGSETKDRLSSDMHRRILTLSGDLSQLWTEPTLISRRERDALLYAGKAGTGFTAETALKLREWLDPLVVPKSPLSKPVKKPKATWVKPELLVDVEYRAVTADGRLRHASFKGVREDLMVRRLSGKRRE
jgi:ATP-dependent DNA ligase